MGYVGKWERTAGSQQGDIIACRVATVGEVTRLRPHISGEDGEECTFCYIPQSPRLYFVCLHCVFAFIATQYMQMCVFVFDCIPFPVSLFTMP